MLFHLFNWLIVEKGMDLGPANVFRYPSFRIVVSLITALCITMFLYPWFIRQLQARQIGQVIRTELDDNHQSKKDTPTMGGILIILAVCVTTLLWADLSNPMVWLALVPTIMFAAIGFIDDAMKLGERGSKGLSERGKLLGQFGVAAAVMGVLLFTTLEYNTELYLPFVSTEKFTLLLPGWLYLIFAMFVIVGASNAVNFTDGLDGLAIGPVITAAGTFTGLAYIASAALILPATVDGVEVLAHIDFAEYLMIPHVTGGAELAVFCASIIGAGVGFLWFNMFPAQVFMGDVGALGIGGALGTVAVLTKNEILSGLILGVFVVEALSVIIQRYWYKMTKKRVFLMAPIHHHYEKKGWSESQIVVRFWIVSILLSLLALASLKLR